MRAVTKPALKLPISEHVQKMLGDVEAVNISEARTQMPKMVRDSAAGATFIIRSARANGAPVAVLIGLENFSRVVAEPKSTRTVGEILESLPFSGMDLKSPTAMELPGAGLPTAFLPK